MQEKNNNYYYLYPDIPLVAGNGLGPHYVGAGHVADEPKPGMGVFAMMTTMSTVPIAVPTNGKSSIEIPA